MRVREEITIEEKKRRVAEMKDFHKKTLEDLGVHPSSFIPKLAYIPTSPPGKTEQVVSMFASEMNKKVDLYIEFAEREAVPMDKENRTLYRLKYNAFYHEEYEKEGPDNALRYLIPISELTVVKKYGTASTAPEPIKDHKQEKVFDLPDNATDLPFDQMTMRDFAAIMLKKPVSHKDWLNRLVENS